MHRCIITTFFVLAALVPATAAHAAGGGQDPLLSGYGSPGTGEQLVLPPPAAGTSKAAKAATAAGESLDPAVTESPAALSVPGSRAGADANSGRRAGGGTGGKTGGPSGSHATALRELTTRPVAERHAIIAAATAGRTESPLFDASDLFILAVALVGLAGFALTARTNRRHG